MQTLDNNQTLDVKEWALTIFISTLPLIGIKMPFVWAFGDNMNIYKRNWAKGTLLIWLIGLMIFMTFLFLFGGFAIISGILNK